MFLINVVNQFEPSDSVGTWNVWICKDTRKLPEATCYRVPCVNFAEVEIVVSTMKIVLDILGTKYLVIGMD